MGSQNIQGPLWGKYAANWANIQEPTGISGYQYALQSLQISPADQLLDIGCGSGLFSTLATDAGARVTGIDASDELINEAKRRAPVITFITGDMEELPFADASFSIACGFNTFQYAANTANALAEANRILQPGGKLVAMIWGNKADCQAASYLKAVGSLLPPPPPTAAASGPFALSENHLLESMVEAAGFKIIQQTDVDAVWDYPNTETALKGLLAAGPAVKAINYSGYQKVYDMVAEAIIPYTQANGHVIYHNKFRVVIAEKAG
jgi:SAM-dependent methyltransferase